MLPFNLFFFGPLPHSCLWVHFSTSGVLNRAYMFGFAGVCFFLTANLLILWKEDAVVCM